MPLIIAGVLSVALHIGGAYALGIMPGQWTTEREQGQREPQPFRTSVPYVTLGEREGSPLSISWITTPEPENHTSVDPSESVQPRLRTEEAAPVLGPQTSAIGPGDQLRRLDAQALRSMTEQVRAAQREALQAVAREASVLLRTPAAFLDLLAREKPAQDEPATDAPTPLAESPSLQPETPGGGAPDPAPEAQVTDQESDPSSTIMAVVDDIGSELTSEGLKLRTFKPIVPPGLPQARGVVVFDIAFDGAGKSYAEIVEASRHPQWDQLYKNVIYQKWTATGPAIERLASTPEDDRVRIRLRISFENSWR